MEVASQHASGSKYGSQDSRKVSMKPFGSYLSSQISSAQLTRRVSICERVSRGLGCDKVKPVLGTRIRLFPLSAQSDIFLFSSLNGWRLFISEGNSILVCLLSITNHIDCIGKTAIYLLMVLRVSNLG